MLPHRQTQILRLSYLLLLKVCKYFLSINLGQYCCPGSEWTCTCVCIPNISYIVHYVHYVQCKCLSLDINIIYWYTPIKLNLFHHQISVHLKLFIHIHVYKLSEMGRWINGEIHVEVHELIIESIIDMDGWMGWINDG